MQTMPNNASTTPDRRHYLLAWLSWSIGAFFYFYEYFIQVSPNVIVPELMQYFQIDATQLGNFALFYFLAYSSMQIPAGILLDKFGVRRLMTVALLFCAVGTLLFAATHSFFIAEVARAIIGFGSAFALLGTLVIVSRYFPQKHFATLTGLLLAVGMSGAICGEAPLAMLVEHLQWQQTLNLLAAIGIVWSLLAFIIIRDHPYAQSGDTMLASPNFKQLRHNMRTILSSGKTWLTAIYGCFMFAPTITLGALWGVSFLLKQYPGIDKPHAAELISSLFFGWACGSPLFGFFSDWLQRRKPPLYLSTLGSLVCSLLILYYPNLPYCITGVLLFLFGLFSSGFVLAFSICRELHEFRFSGSALGFMNMMNALGAALIPPLAGIILDLSLKGQHVHGSIAPYTLANFKVALTLVPICFVISCIILPFIPETRAKSVL